MRSLKPPPRAGGQPSWLTTVSDRRTIVGVLVLVLLGLAASNSSGGSSSNAFSVMGLTSHHPRRPAAGGRHYAENLVKRRGPGYLSRPFNLEDEVAFNTRTYVKECGDRVPRGHVGRKMVKNLAVARSGSETLTMLLKQIRQPAHHNHACTLTDVIKTGAKRVVLTIRHPMDRIVSGYLRRCPTWSPNDALRPRQMGRNPLKQGNRDFHNAFETVDLYLTALRVQNHPLHSLALNVTYGEELQQWCVPITEYYLRDWKHPDTALASSWWERDGVDVQFICTKQLNDGFARVARHWGLKMPDLSTHVHSSHYVNKTRVTPSSTNQAWIEQLYARDVALYNQHCGGSSPAR